MGVSDFSTTERMSLNSKPSGEGVGVDVLTGKICLVARPWWRSLEVARHAQGIALIVMAQGFGDALLG